MKDKALQQLIDRELSTLEWTDQQRLDTLRLMRQPERRPMKKQFVLALTLLLLLASTLTGFAIGKEFATLQDFSAHPTNSYAATLLGEPVDDAAIVTPTNSRHTSRWVDAAITQMYQHEDRLFIVSHLVPKEPDTVLYAESAGEVILDGKPLRYFDLFRREELTILTSLGLTLNWEDLRGAYDPDGEISILLQSAIPDPQGCGLTLLTVCEVPDTLPVLGHGSYTLQAEFTLMNARTGEYERNVIFADVPPMQSR